MADPHPPASRDDPRIISLGPDRPGAFFRIEVHGPELVNLKRPAVLAETRLAEQDRAPAGQLDHHGTHNHDGQGNHQGEGTDNYIYNFF